MIGGLEEGNAGAAFLALKSGAPVIPIGLTGTENSHVYSHLRRWRRAPVTLVVGKPFFLSLPEHNHENEALSGTKGQKMMREATRQIMESLARLLPESYRGIYKSNPEK